MIDRILIINARWQNVAFYKCCCYSVAFRSTSKRDKDKKLINKMKRLMYEVGKVRMA